MNKRQFMLGSCAGLLAAPVLPAAAALPAGAGLRARPPELLGDGYSLAKWRRYQGHLFALAGGRGSLRLESVRARTGKAGGLEQFELRFSALELAEPLGRATRLLQHASGQRLALYLEPVGEAQYLACFSLLT